AVDVHRWRDRHARRGRAFRPDAASAGARRARKRRAEGAAGRARGGPRRFSGRGSFRRHRRRGTASRAGEDEPRPWRGAGCGGAGFRPRDGLRGRSVALGPEFTVTIEEGAQAGSRAVRVSGELDSGNCDSVMEAFEQAIASQPSRLELDLEEVSFIDSAGTRAVILIERSARERGVELVVVPPPEEVTALLRTAGVTERVNFSATAASAPRGGEFVERVELEFPRAPESPARARAEIREALDEVLDETQLANVVLLTS